MLALQHKQAACALKRQRSGSLDSDHTQHFEQERCEQRQHKAPRSCSSPSSGTDLLAASVLRSLKAARWQQACEEPEQGEASEEQGTTSSESCCAADDELPATAAVALEPEHASTSSSESAGACSAGHRALSATSLPKPFSLALLSTPLPTPALAAATRSYVWRGPSRKLSAPLPLPFGLGGACSGSSEPEPSAKSECCGESDRDKDWAALTTWLRMNLHHPRTAKRQVLFVGSQQAHDGRRWLFQLNPALTWDDVSAETKLRLRSLPQETEVAFSRKYPGKPGCEWVHKTQKYRPPGCSSTFLVPLCDMIHSLGAIYQTHERQ